MSEDVVPPKIFAAPAPKPAKSGDPPPGIGVERSGRRRTNAAFDKMKALGADRDEAEIRLRYRAFG